MMEDMFPTAAVTLNIDNSTSEGSEKVNVVGVTRLKLVAETVSLSSDQLKLVAAESVSNHYNKYRSCAKDVTGIPAVGNGSEEKVVWAEMLHKHGGNPVADGFKIQESGQDDGLVLAYEQNRNTGNETFPIEVEIKKSCDNHVDCKAAILVDSDIGCACSGEIKVAAVGPITQLSDNPDVKEVGKQSAESAEEKNIRKCGSRSVFELEWIPLWGCVSICGKRPEMEDAVAAVPQCIRIPIKMLIGDCVIDGLSQSITHQNGHYFGVYDGHGGAQVANYCRDRMHLALAEEMSIINNDLDIRKQEYSRQRQWENAFGSCFLKVDDEIGGRACRVTLNGKEDYSDINLETVAPETVGSTAVVALVCSSHVIVSNCGDSRAIMCRGKEPIALSVDHKPNREDEYARIESVGGKIIQWNGHRVLGVLAMSRSIGDRYLKPSIIPEPEIMFVPRGREDDCLILASDGLWDVMTNEEACEVARKRILLWHKRNEVSSLVDRGKGVDPAAQAAADHLSMLALQKGSKDNISVIVVDLKAHRKFKNKS